MNLKEWIILNSKKLYEKEINHKDLISMNFILEDFSNIQVSSDDLEKLLEIYYELNEKNQKIFEELINSDFESFVTVLRFCRNSI